MAKLTKKEIIFQAAARLFKDYGYQATSMRQLAKEVGLEASSLYSHISSKQELLAQICMSEANKYLNHMNKVMKEDEGIIDILRAMSYFHIEVAVEDPVSATVFSDEWRYLEEPTLGEFRAIRKEYESRILHIIARGVNEEVLVNEDPFILFQAFLSSFKWIYIYNKPGRALDKDQVKKTITDVIIRGLQK
jgi:AcrR family transcriptional regulator